MARNIRRGRKVVYDMEVHLVFVAVSTQKVITSRVRRRLQEICASVCADFGGKLREMETGDDYIHLVVTYPPKYSVSKLVNSLKLVSCRLLKKMQYPEIERGLFGKHFWTPSYFAGSSGDNVRTAVREYISSQRIGRDTHGMPQRKALVKPRRPLGRIRTERTLGGH